MPAPLRALLEKRRETVKFLLVGGTCFLITNAVTYLLKFTILSAKPVTALIIGIIVATIVSYVLNREWSFRTRGGRRRHTEMLLFVVVNLIATGINAAPAWIARYVFLLDAEHYSVLVEEISYYISGMILGTALAMVFRLWAFRAWVFPQELIPADRDPDAHFSELSESPADMVGQFSSATIPIAPQGHSVEHTPQPLQYS